MGRLRLVLGASLAIVAFAAAVSPAGATSPEPRYGQHGGYVLPPGATSHNAPTRGAGLCAGGQMGCTPPLGYHGGRVMPQSTVYAIFWAPGGSSAYPAGYESVIDRFFTDVSADSGRATNAYGVMPQYTDSDGNHANYDVSFAGAFDDTNAYPAVLQQCHPLNPDGNSETDCIWDDAGHHQINDEVKTFASANHLTMDASHIFFVFFPPHVTSCDNNTMDDCAYTSYCAYHQFADGTSNPLYANIPYGGDGSYSIPCYNDADEPNANVADHVLSATSHEHIETITDPGGDAWYDSSGAEIADECAFYFGTLNGTGATKYTNTINGTTI